MPVKKSAALGHSKSLSRTNGGRSDLSNGTSISASFKITEASRPFAPTSTPPSSLASLHSKPHQIPKRAPSSSLESLFANKSASTYTGQSPKRRSANVSHYELNHERSHTPTSVLSEPSFSVNKGHSRTPLSSRHIHDDFSLSPTSVYNYPKTSLTGLPFKTLFPELDEPMDESSQISHDLLRGANPLSSYLDRSPPSSSLLALANRKPRKNDERNKDEENRASVQRKPLAELKRSSLNVAAITDKYRSGLLSSSILPVGAQKAAAKQPETKPLKPKTTKSKAAKPKPVRVPKVKSSSNKPKRTNNASNGKDEYEHKTLPVSTKRKRETEANELDLSGTESKYEVVSAAHKPPHHANIHNEPSPIQHKTRSSNEQKELESEATARKAAALVDRLKRQSDDELIETSGTVISASQDREQAYASMSDTECEHAHKQQNVNVEERAKEDNEKAVSLGSVVAFALKHQERPLDTHAQDKRGSFEVQFKNELSDYQEYQDDELSIIRRPGTRSRSTTKISPSPQPVDTPSSTKNTKARESPFKTKDLIPECMMLGEEFSKSELKISKGVLSGETESQNDVDMLHSHLKIPHAFPLSHEVESTVDQAQAPRELIEQRVMQSEDSRMQWLQTHDLQIGNLLAEELQHWDDELANQEEESSVVNKVLTATVGPVAAAGKLTKALDGLGSILFNRLGKVIHMCDKRARDIEEDELKDHVKRLKMEGEAIKQDFIKLSYEMQDPGEKRASK